MMVEGLATNLSSQIDSLARHPAHTHFLGVTWTPVAYYIRCQHDILLSQVEDQMASPPFSCFIF